MITAIVAVLLLNANAFAATLDAIEGTVVVKPATSNSFIVTPKDKLPLELSAGSKITTDPSSKAKIILKDGSELSLAPNSEFQIQNESNIPNGPSALSLVTGKLRAWVTPQKSALPNWKIKTPTAIMGVRGTEFLVDTNDDRSVVCAFEGKVEVTTTADGTSKTEITENQGVVVRGTKITPPAKMDNHLMDWWRKETLIGSSQSENTVLRNLSETWLWAGPGTVNTLNPSALYSDSRLFYLGGEVWTKAVFTDQINQFESALTPPKNAFFVRSKLNVKVPLNTSFLVLGEGLFSAKWGNPTNEEASSARLQQLLFLYNPNASHAFAIGRQEWHLGDGVLIGKDPWSLIPRSFDSIFAAIRFSDVRFRFLGASLGDRVSSWELKDFVYGTYVDFAKFPTELFLVGVTRNGQPHIVSGSDLKTRFGLIGERTYSTFLKHFYVQDEFHYEFGSIYDVGKTQVVSSYLGRTEVGGHWRLFGLDGLSQFNFFRVSGDKHSDDSRYSAYLPVAPDSHRFLGLVNAFPNLQAVQKLGFSSKINFPVLNRPARFEFEYSHFNRVDLPESEASTTLGNEFDFILTYEPLDSLNLMAGYGFLHPGGAITSPQSNAYLGFFMAQYKL